MIKKYKSYLIIGNEFCERFCFYAMKTILFSFLRNEYEMSKKASTYVVHLFVSVCYFFTLFGGIISDVVLGKYKTILYLSLIYLLGTIFTTYSSFTKNTPGLFFIGLGFISIGTGGIKPCVAAFGGDQIREEVNQKKLRQFFSFFYFAINLGGMLSSFLVPVLANIRCSGSNTCYPLAFGSSSFLLLISIVLFALGSKYYVKTRPSKKSYKPLINFLKLQNSQSKITSSTTITHTSLSSDNEEQTSVCILDLVKMFVPVIFFWMLYDQQSSSWIEQGSKMQDTVFFYNYKFRILAPQMQTWNSVLILCFIPLFSHFLYPTIEYIGYNLTSIRKMTLGIFLASLSFIASAILEHHIAVYYTTNQKVCILWQLPQYILITAAEILVNMTGLEFAYSLAKSDLKTVILSAWLLNVAIGNLFVVIYSYLDLTAKLSLSEPETCNFIFFSLIGLLSAFYMSRLKLKSTKK